MFAFPMTHKLAIPHLWRHYPSLHNVFVYVSDNFRREHTFHFSIGLKIRIILELKRWLHS